MLSVLRDVFGSRPVKSAADVTAMEYDLIPALVAAAIITAAQLIGMHMGTMFGAIATNL